MKSLLIISTIITTTIVSAQVRLYYNDAQWYSSSQCKDTPDILFQNEIIAPCPSNATNNCIPVAGASIFRNITCTTSTSQSVLGNELYVKTTNDKAVTYYKVGVCSAVGSKYYKYAACNKDSVTESVCTDEKCTQCQSEVLASKESKLCFSNGQVPSDASVLLVGLIPTVFAGAVAGLIALL